MTLGPNGTIIGRPKKPPIIGSEKTDGMNSELYNRFYRNWNKNLHLPCSRMWKDIPRLFFP